MPPIQRQKSRSTIRLLIEASRQPADLKLYCLRIQIVARANSHVRLVFNSLLITVVGKAKAARSCCTTGHFRASHSDWLSHKEFVWVGRNSTQIKDCEFVESRLTLQDITSGQRCWQIYMNRVSVAKYKHNELEPFGVSGDETVYPAGHS